MSQRVRLQVDFGPALAAAPAAIGAFVGFVGLLADALPLGVRAVIFGVALLCALVAWWLHRRLQKSRAVAELPIEAVEAEFDALSEIDGIGLSSHAVEMLQRSIFASSAGGRLSIYEIDSESASPVARRIARFSSDGFYQAGGRPEFAVERSFLRELRGADTTTLGGGHANASGEAPDRDIDPEAWRLWQLEVLRDGDTVDALRMPSRKYSWFAIRDPNNPGRTLALMAESADPLGIDQGRVDSNALAMLLPALVQQVEAGSRVAARIDAVRRKLRSVAVRE